MWFVALKGLKAIGYGDLSRKHVRYCGERGLSPDLIVPVPFRPEMPKIKVRERSGETVALDVCGGVWVARGIRADSLTIGDIIVPLDPDLAERISRPLREPIPDHPDPVQSLDGEVSMWHGVWLLRAREPRLVYPLGLLDAGFRVRRLGEGLAATDGGRLIVLGAGGLLIGSISFDAPDFPMSHEDLFAEIRRAWEAMDLARLRGLQKATLLLSVARARGLTPRRWVAMGEALGIETEEGPRAVVGLAVKWNICVKKEGR